MIKLGLVVLLLALVSNSDTVYARTIYVDGAHGVDNSSCWDGGQTLPCLNLNLALLGMQQQNFTTIFIEKGTYELYPDSSATVFQWMTNLTIVGNDTLHPGIDPEVLINCTKEAGLTFLHSTNITLKNVVLSDCGALHNSTSRNSTESPFLEFHVGLYFLFCKDVTFFQLTVTNSNGMGAVMYSTVGKNSIEHSTFSFNQVSSSENWGGGGLYIEFSYCSPEDTNCSESQSNIPYEYATNAVYTIHSSSFHDNVANIGNLSNDTFRIPQKTEHLSFGHGGGLSIYFKGKTANSTVLINETHFANNKAFWGAGLYVEFLDLGKYNKLEVYSSSFDGNECYGKNSAHTGTGGGGARLGYIFFNDTHVRNNSMLFDACEFSNNQAYYGGGLSFYAAREPTESSPTNTLEFQNCEWFNNTARFSSAVDLSVWHPVPKGASVKPRFTNCTFYQNFGSYTTKLGSHVGMGALFVDSLPIQFTKEVTFEENTNSALAGLTTAIFFDKGCVAVFRNNLGRKGGAVALLGSSFIEISPNTQFFFINNSAQILGGAIYSQSVGGSDLASFRNCFLRYSEITATPLQWTTQFYFERNTAKGESNSIYATSLFTCLWSGRYGPTQNERGAKKVFCWSDNWKYASNDCNSEIATAPARFSTKWSAYNMASFPGKRELLPLVMYDDRGNNVTNKMILTARSLVPNAIYLDTSTLYISDNTIMIHGEPNATGKIRLETVDPRVLYTEVDIHIKPCPPGMILTGNLSRTECICRGNYGGLINCFQVEYRAKLQRGAWIGHHTHSGSSELVAGGCPYCLFADKQYFYLPQNVANLIDTLCGSIHRSGTLCGKCKAGYGPAVNTNSFECVKCSSQDARYYWLFYVLTQFLSITIFYLVVACININVTSAPANAFIFFAQVLTTTFKLDGDGTIQMNNNIITALYIVPYDVWNLNFFLPVFPKFCLSPQISTLQLLSLGYLTALFPLILIVISYLLVQLHNNFRCQAVKRIYTPFERFFKWLRNFTGRDPSLIDTFATFLLLSYTKFTLVSLILLTSTNLIDDNGNQVGPKVVYYDGTIVYLSKDHLPFYLPAILVLATFVSLPPLILCAPSIIQMLKRRFCANREQGRCNLLEGERMNRMKLNVEQFLKTFQGCYKDGTEEDQPAWYDLRFFAGFYFILRILLFTVYALAPGRFKQYAIQQLICMFAVLLFLLIHPYKDDFYNKLDALFFTILASVNTLTMYNYYLATLNMKFEKWAFAFQYILIFIPLFYMLGFLLVRGRKWLKSKRSDRMNSIEMQQHLNGEDPDEASQLFLEEARHRIETSNRPIQKLKHDMDRHPLLQSSPPNFVGANSQ